MVGANRRQRPSPSHVAKHMLQNLQEAAWDPLHHDEEVQRLMDPVARSAATAAETQLQVRVKMYPMSRQMRRCCWAVERVWRSINDTRCDAGYCVIPVTERGC